MSHLNSSLALEEINEEHVSVETNFDLLNHMQHLSINNVSTASQRLQVVKVSGSIIVSF